MKQLKKVVKAGGNLKKVEIDGKLIIIIMTNWNFRARKGKER